MAYVPKSKYKILYTPGGELIYKGSTMPYIGDYIKMSNGSYYVGKNINKTNLELIKPLKTPKGFSTSVMQSKYNLLKPKKFDFLRNTKQIQPSKPLPLLKDYQKGFIKRYFAKRNNNDLGYFEIDKETYSSLKKHKGEYDHVLYTMGFIEWSLEGDIIKTNKNILHQKEKKFPNVSLLFPILNEFSKEQKAKHSIKGRVYSDGKEIPTNLPPIYGLPKKPNQYCQNCRFRKKEKCTIWEAKIRTGYWCKSWKMLQTNAPTFNPTQLPQYNSQTQIKKSGGSGGTSYSGGESSGGEGGGY
tara:strand:+ start:7612 stop:8508 length:897 start_codon:yes stop_codon:yes gene_type:complete